MTEYICTVLIVVMFLVDKLRRAALLLPDGMAFILNFGTLCLDSFIIGFPTWGAFFRHHEKRNYVSWPGNRGRTRVFMKYFIWGFIVVK